MPPLDHIGFKNRFVHLWNTTWPACQSHFRFSEIQGSKEINKLSLEILWRNVLFGTFGVSDRKRLERTSSTQMCLFIVIEVVFGGHFVLLFGIWRTCFEGSETPLFPGKFSTFHYFLKKSYNNLQTGLWDHFGVLVFQIVVCLHPWGL